MMKIFNFKKAIVLSMLIFTSTACNQPQTRRLHEAEQVQVPELASETQRHWNFLKDVTYTSGAIIFWANTATGQQFSHLLKTFDESNRATADLYRYHLDKIIPLKVKLSKNTDSQNALAIQKQNIIRSWKQEHKQDLIQRRQIQIEKAGTWIENEIATTPTVFRAELQNHAKKVFDKYCDAKLWEMATDPKFFNRNFLLRPTPLAICEESYRSRHIFLDDSQTDNECSPAPASLGKDYLPCFWIAASRTQFIGENGLYPSSTQDKMVSMLQDIETLKQNLSSGLQDQIRIGSRRAIESAFRVMNPQKDKTFETITIGRMIQAIEAKEDLLAVMMRGGAPIDIDVVSLVPSHIGEVALEPETIEHADNIIQQIKLLVLKRFQNQTSLNDVLFNDFLVTNNVINEPSDFTLDDFNIVDSDGFIDPKLVAPIQQKLESLGNQNKELSAEYNAALKNGTAPSLSNGCGRENSVATVYCKNFYATNRKLKAAMDKNPLLAKTVFTSSWIKTYPITNKNAVLVQVKINDAFDKTHSVGYGCFLVSSGEPIVCQPRNPDDKQISVNFDPIAQKMTIRLQLDNPESWGFENNYQDDITRNFIPVKDLRNQILQLELFANIYDGLIPYISGDAKIIHPQSGETLQLGEVAHLFDNSLNKQIFNHSHM